MTATYRALRAELARTTAQHWGVLRLITTTPDPRCVAAEAVASHATHLMQLPALWTALHIQEAIISEAIDDTARNAIRELQLSISSNAEIAQLANAVDTLDLAARRWCAFAHNATSREKRSEGAP